MVVEIFKPPYCWMGWLCSHLIHSLSQLSLMAWKIGAYESAWPISKSSFMAQLGSSNIKPKLFDSAWLGKIKVRATLALAQLELKILACPSLVTTTCTSWQSVLTWVWQWTVQEVKHQWQGGDNDLYEQTIRIYSEGIMIWTSRQSVLAWEWQWTVQADNEEWQGETMACTL
jgi:hypothetical protein